MAPRSSPLDQVLELLLQVVEEDRVLLTLKEVLPGRSWSASNWICRSRRRRGSACVERVVVQIRGGHGL